MSPARRALLVVGAAAALLVTGATPAAAHGSESVPATNQEPRILSVTAAPEGLSVRIVDVGEHVEVRNDGATEVTVLGYDGEPYLRVGPDGVFRNRRSPATYWNEQDVQTQALPDGFDAGATPDWERISDGHVTRWHDHRAHWMGAEPTGAERVLTTWEITLVADGEEIVVRGDIVQREPPSPVVPLALGLVVAVIVLLSTRTRAWPLVLLGGVVALTGFASVDVIGRWAATTRSGPTKLLDSVYVLAGGVLTGWAAVRFAQLARRGTPYEGTPMVLLAAVVATLALALGQLSWLGRALLPTEVSPALARALAGLAVGTGIGTVTGAALRLQRPGDQAVPPPGAPAPERA